MKENGVSSNAEAAISMERRESLTEATIGPVIQTNGNPETQTSGSL